MTQQIFRRHFNINRNDSVPSGNAVLLWVRNCRETASAAKRISPGREPSRTPENIEWVRQAFVRSPRRSASRNAIALMSDRTVRRILHENLNFNSYKMVMVQAINDQDTVNRKTVRFCWTLWITTTLTTDEANFHPCGNNSQHCRYWATENPRDIYQKPLHSEMVIVWCGVV